MSIPMMKTDTYPIDDLPQLIKTAKNEPLAFARLYDHFSKSVYRYLYSRVGNQADAEDLTAQTFLTALEKLPRYRERGNFKAWLFTIARNKAMDHFRKKQPEAISKVDDQIVEQNDLLNYLIQSEQIQQLASLIRDLDEDEQELLRLRYVADLSFSEMAALLDKHQDAVKKSLYRLQARLQNQMEVKNV
jgi:RNA polymerase sigma-70 factor (ECF subfamily)